MGPLLSADASAPARLSGPRLRGRAVRLLEAERYMAAHLDRRAPLSQLAAKAQLSVWYFHRLFKATYGLSPREYHQRLRLDHARHLIALGDPLSQVAHACGFCDQSHLTRVFKRVVGLPPGSFATRCATEGDREPFTMSDIADVPGAPVSKMRLPTPEQDAMHHQPTDETEPQDS